MWWIVLCSIVLWATSARGNLLFASVDDWNEVVAAATAVVDGIPAVPWEPPLGEEELREVFDSVWSDIQKTCPSLPKMKISEHVEIGFDDALLLPGGKYDRVLGWASRLELLFDDKWQGVLATDTTLRWAVGMGYERFGTLKVAREPPGGWFRETGKPCVNRFRLQDTITHELLHLLGVSSSVKQGSDGSLSVGSPFHGECYPGAFDLAITDEHGQQVVSARCAFNGSLDEPLFVEGVELFLSDEEGGFSNGASMSHLLSESALLTATQGACEPAGARNMTNLDSAVLGAIGVRCDEARLTTVPTTSNLDETSLGLRSESLRTAQTRSSESVSAVAPPPGVPPLVQFFWLLTLLVLAAGIPADRAEAS